MRLLHGSNRILMRPTLAGGKPTNDYGSGFYCTRELEMAKEWACKENTDGFVNIYELQEEGLTVLNMLDGEHTVLNWIAILLQNRLFSIQDEISLDAKTYLLTHFVPDTAGADIIVGYRADDSYFSYAQAFLNNTLPLRSLSRALTLGKLGVQVALVSDKAFSRLSFVNAEPVPKAVYYPKYQKRDSEARRVFREEIRTEAGYRNDVFVLDILREEIKNDDPRIQRIVLS